MPRFFATDAATYEAVRLTLDAAWGHPKPGALTCIEPAATAPRDSSGIVLLGVNFEFCEFPEARDALSQLLAGGAVEEITEAEYFGRISRAGYPTT
jgi:hypothetical protein